jgi:hypothetical protein
MFLVLRSLTFEQNLLLEEKYKLFHELITDKKIYTLIRFIHAVCYCKYKSENSLYDL